MENEINGGAEPTISEEVVTQEVETLEVETPKVDTSEVETLEKQPEDSPKLTREQKYEKALAIANRYAPKEEKQKVETPQVNTETNSLELGRIYSRVDNSSLPPELADTAVERVQKIAQLDGVSLNEAYQSEDFKIWEERQVKAYKAERSQLGVSNGGKAVVKKSLSTPNLSPEDHKALWKEKMS